MLYVNQSYHGPIRGLRLPQYAWQALQNADIATLDELKAVAVRIERLPGVGPKTAQVIRAELDRIALL
jgi:endonuclease III